MLQNTKNLILEIDDANFNFYTFHCNENLETKVLDYFKIKSVGIENGKIININEASKVIKKYIEQIEKKINFIFKEVIIISNQIDYECINVSSYKKLTGSQLLENDISYIINNLKIYILDNDPKKSLIHLFNSKFILDKQETENLPIGLFGDYYKHQLTFFLMPLNDIKNLKNLIGKCNLNVKRILFKTFLDGANFASKNNDKKTFFKINIFREKSEIIFFDKYSYIYSEQFKFGTEIILRDVSKICSLKYENVKNLFSELNLNDPSLNKETYLDKKYFKGELFRKISISHIKNIIEARIIEIIDIIYKNNSNLAFFKKKNIPIIILFEDLSIFNNFREFFKKFFTKEEVTISLFSTEDNTSDTFAIASEIMVNGWEKEALPIVETKKSLISRFFNSFFG